MKGMVTCATGMCYCLKLVMRCTFLILVTCHPGNLHLRQKGYMNPWLIFEVKANPRAKKFGKLRSMS